MQSETNLTASKPQLLIPRHHRRRFALLFTLITGIALFFGLWAGQAVFLLPIFQQLFLPTNPNVTADVARNSLLLRQAVFRAIETTIVSLTLGVAQWVILRRYIPSWWWIVATTAGWLCISVIPIALTATLVQSGMQLSRGLLLIIGILINLLCYICLGFAQRFVLMPYVVAAWKWIFVPLFYLVVAAVINIPLYLISLRQQVEVSLLVQSVVSLVGKTFSYGFIPAVILCTFREKPEVTAKKFKFTAPEITNLTQIQRLSKNLYNKLNAAWQQESNLTSDSNYFVAVAEDGEIIAYQPASEMDRDRVQYTPLPELINNSRHSGDENYISEPVAQFKVTFTPTGGIKINQQ